MEVAHVGVVRGEEHADVAGESGENERLDAEVVEQYVERGGEEAGVLRLEDEVVVLFGAQKLGDRSAGHAVLQAVLQNLLEVRLPLAEVVVDIDDRHARGSRAPLQLGEPARHRQRVAQKFLAAAEVQIVDHVYQQQRHIRLVRHEAVQVFVLSGHSSRRLTPSMNVSGGVPQNYAGGMRQK